MDRTTSTRAAATAATADTAASAATPTTATAVNKGVQRAAGPIGVGLALAALATVVWSGSFVTSRALADSVPPIQHAFWRWIIAIAAVAPFAVRQTWRQRALLRKHIRFLLIASLLGVTIYNTLVNQAGVTTTAGNMGMIMAASPVLMAVYERLGGARLGARRVTGMLVACAGVLVLVSGGSLSMDFAVGDLWIIAGAVSFGSYSALLKRKPAEIGGLPFLFATFVLGALMLLPVFVVSFVVQGGFEPTVGTVSPLLYVGVVSSAIAFFAWNKAISIIGAARAGVIYYLQPVCVALLSFAVLGEAMGWLQVMCMGLILGGVVLGAARAKK
ncbi:DMT family transporter [Streptomyces sp. NPDC051218]|uniref:DMT family transporter n=1 Tax=Streptomyces sp. NPDC051218 TaxID=3365645 RepID=UPI00379C39BE